MNTKQNTMIRRSGGWAGTVLLLTACLLMLTAWTAGQIASAASGPNSAAGEDCTVNQKARKHYVNVAVATLWTEPGLARKLDAPSLTNPVNMEKWTAAMSTADQRRWLTGKLETQALYGQEVRLLKVQGDWAYVAVIGQSTPRSKYGYPGWLPRNQILTTTTGAAYSKCPTAIVNAKTAKLYDTDRKKSLLTLSFNTRLPVVATEGSWLQVHTPDNGTAWLRKQDADVYDQLSDIPTPTGAELVETGRQFLGLPYLWAGVSAYGFDCSGFTSTIYGFHGIDLPRDASAQIKEGTKVGWSEMQPGDLMFFAHNNGKGSVHHVSMYIGNGQMMHSPKAGKTVEIIPIDTPAYKKEFAGARRYLK
ncbi:C40 family peptidase [Paenibacillus wulumuqiensis]|uniref:C40 family peptidase n=1 Tax=Paenibacillus wulumuqiensis TaxID=1567107 RepID=UPI0009E5C54C|nr:C40 family peptidase [Paenibacillus wulumuqiensis]